MNKKWRSHNINVTLIRNTRMNEYNWCNWWVDGYYYYETIHSIFSVIINHLQVMGRVE